MGITSKQQGVALFAVLILCTICLLILSQISYRHQLDQSASSRSIIQDRSILLALSAESWARRNLRDDASDNQTDSFEDNWAFPIPPLPVEGGTLRGCLVDMQSKFNLNNLQAFDIDRWNDELASLSSSDLDAYLNLLAILEQDSSEFRAASIVDWTDTNSESLIPGSPESQDYLLQTPARLSADTRLTNIEELAGVIGYSEADVLLLYPYVTALPTNTPININTASPEVLTALSSLMDRFLVESIVEERPFASVNAFYTFLEGALGFLTLNELREQLPQSMISVNSSYFELLATVDLVDQQLKMRSLIQRNGADAVVFMREFQMVPSVLSEPLEGIVSTFDCIEPPIEDTEQNIEDFL